jgi:predicted transcriptional regulator
MNKRMKTFYLSDEIVETIEETAKSVNTSQSVVLEAMIRELISIKKEKKDQDEYERSQKDESSFSEEESE